MQAEASEGLLAKNISEELLELELKATPGFSAMHGRGSNSNSEYLQVYDDQIQMLQAHADQLQSQLAEQAQQHEILQVGEQGCMPGRTVHYLPANLLVS